MLTQAPKGTRDILPSEVYRWQYVENAFAEICRLYGYEEIRIPVFEHTELFQRGVGDTTDIVQKEMYTFEDKGGRSLSLRPEGTAGVARSFIEHGMASMPQPVKLYYNITAYRYENVQRGRYREFRQFGAEAFGAPGPEIDVEIVSLVDEFIKKLGIKGVGLHINSIGCPVCRKPYNEILREYFRPSLGSLCVNCRSRYERNPLRIADCKEEGCRPYAEKAPALLEHLCDDCRNHFEGLKERLDALGISYEIDKDVVRGLDYYTKTVFEFISEDVGTQGTICGGGRYDGLIEAFGGPSTPGIGFGMGIERLLMAMESRGPKIPEPDGPAIYIASMGKRASDYAGRLVRSLRSSGVNAEKDLLGRSLRSQMKYADKLGAVYTVVLGDAEMETGKAVLKNMRSGETKDVSLDSIVDRLKKS